MINQFSIDGFGFNKTDLTKYCKENIETPYKSANFITYNGC